MATQLLLGNESLAQGAIDAGLSGAYAYPGTPSTEITAYVLRSHQAAMGDISCAWTANEKTALEAALGMSYGGKRAMASMKHVGLNVAADPFINSAISGSHGGLIINVADDPSMHSSQNEQDSRVYLDLAMMPCLEPADQQEAYHAPAIAFALSERYRIPVMIRLTTRLCHSRATITTGAMQKRNAFSLPDDPKRFILLPALARKSYAKLLDRQLDFTRESETSPFTTYCEGTDLSTGIIACGTAYHYVREIVGENCPHPILKIGQYPLPLSLIERMMSECDRVLVFEDGYPYVEGKLRGVPLRSSPIIHGRLSGHLPRTGELNPDHVASAFGLEMPSLHEVSTIPAPRPPALCPGCPHGDTCRALNAVLKSDDAIGKLFSDIGCYTLSAMPPYESVDTCVEMGASITMAKGASQAGLHPSVALIGDSTFTHSGMTGLLDCVNENANVTVVIVDNLTIAMTGGQKSSANNRLADICAGLGVDPAHIRIITPLPNKHDENVEVIRQEIAFEGPSVVIAVRECIQTARRSRSKGGAS
ncbi:indolepyruvate ferredoxin oxidoreductase [Candidatus Bipolaricaulota bacterium]|nr:indolepyruvate ferredoxin oxidoreductase [Candidatus Bipolaricaulota bacterium]